MQALSRLAGLSTKTQPALLHAPLRCPAVSSLGLAIHQQLVPVAAPCSHVRSRSFSSTYAMAEDVGSNEPATSPAADGSEVVNPYYGQKLPGLYITDVPNTPYCIVNFYHLVDIPDPQAVVAKHRKYLEGKDVKGRIWISSQGINSQFGGSSKDAIEYTLWIADQPEFKGLRFSLWPANDHMFPKLRLKYKPNLISLAGGMTGLPITAPIESRATPLSPEQWKEMLQVAQQQREQAQADADARKQQIIVLDVRNDYEWDAGHFVGAARPLEEEFNETPVPGEDNAELEVPKYIAEADPETPIMMYCTGGIRCDVYTAALQRKGFKNLYTLDGGIQNYLVQEGGEMWNGSLFVFDGRMAIPPGEPSADDVLAAEEEGAPLPAAVPCQICSTESASLPHMNCANIDCNELFIACPTCKAKWNGCCCESCMQAPRLLRPAKMEGGHYGAWGNYADMESIGPVMAEGRNHEGRVARRARRREVLKEKRQLQLLARQERKQMVRDAMAKLALLEEQEEQLQEQQQQQQQAVAV